MDETRQFLLEASLIPKNSSIVTNLRNKVFNEESNKIKVDQNAICKWCYSSWSDGNISFKVEPQRKKKPRKRPGLPKRFNVLVIKCQVCDKSTKIFMAKQKVDKSPPEAEKEGPVKKKKKKKKDPFVGLNPQAFSSPQTPLINQTNKSNNKLPTQVKFTSSPNPQASPLQTPKLNQTLTNKPSLNLKSNIDSSVKKSKKKSNKKKKKKTSLVSSFVNEC